MYIERGDHPWEKKSYGLATCLNETQISCNPKHQTSNLSANASCFGYIFTKAKAKAKYQLNKRIKFISAQCILSLAKIAKVKFKNLFCHK